MDANAGDDDEVSPDEPWPDDGWHGARGKRTHRAAEAHAVDMARLKKAEQDAWKDPALALLVLLLVCAVVAFVVGRNQSGDSNNTSDAPATETTQTWDEHCAEWAPQAREDYPTIYYTNQEAYDYCMEVPGFLDEVKGNIDRRK